MSQGLWNPASFLPDEVHAELEGLGFKSYENIQQAQAECSTIYTSFHGSRSLVPQFENVSSDVLALGAFDTLNRQGNRWWPEISLKKDLQRIIAEKQWSLERQIPCFLLGEEATLRWMLSFVLQMGFREIVIFHEEPDWANGYQKMGTQIHWLSLASAGSSQLPMGSFMLVHLESDIDEGIFEPLRYLHFLKDNAYFLDLSRRLILNAEFIRAENQLKSVAVWRDIFKYRASLKSLL